MAAALAADAAAADAAADAADAADASGRAACWHVADCTGLRRLPFRVRQNTRTIGIHSHQAAPAAVVAAAEAADSGRGSRRRGRVVGQCLEP